jgi:hypothetical protein
VPPYFQRALHRAIASSILSTPYILASVHLTRKLGAAPRRALSYKYYNICDV